MSHVNFHLPPAHLCAAGHFTAEGPIWDRHRGVFFYADIEGGTLHRYDPKKDETTTWQIGAKGTGDKNGQMLGGTIALNSDGSLILLLEQGPNAGVNYFDPDHNQLLHIPGSIPAEEMAKPHNRANDSTVIDTGKEKLMVYGTMSKKWERHKQPDDSIPASGFEGDYYVLDSNLVSHKLKFEKNSVFPGVVITNALASGGVNPDGTVELYFSETVGARSALNVYRGKLDLKDYTVKDVEIFANHRTLTDGREGRPDGANMVYINGKPMYGVAVLQTGEIRLFNPENKSLAASLKLPPDIANVTKFAIGEDKDGKPAMFVTTINFAYPKDKHTSPSGSTFLLKLPEQISLNPASVRETDYEPMAKVQERFSASSQGTPSTVQTLGNTSSIIQPTIEKGYSA